MSRNTANVLAVMAAACGPAAAADLTDLSLESLLETRVTSASKYEQALIDVPAAVSVITRDEIRVYGWRTLGQALASLPGIYLTSDLQYDYLGTRGFGMPGDFNTRVLLAVNGNRINDIVYDSAALGRTFPIDLDLIERIEFIPGPGGAVYGQNAMFGVINVITRNGLQVDGWELTGSVQQPQDMREGRVRWGRRLANGTDLMFALGTMRADGEDLPMQFPGAAPNGGTLTGIARGLDAEADDEASLHVGRGAWTFDARFGTRTKDDPTGAYFSDPLVAGQYERDDYLLTHLQYQFDVAPAWNLLGRAFTGRERYSALFKFDGNPNFSTGISEWYGGELRLLHTGFAAHKLMVGIEAQDNPHIDQTAHSLAPPPDARIPRVAPTEVPNVIARDGYRLGLYVQDEWQLSERVSTSLGLRIDNNDSTATRLSPRAALIWRAAPALTFKTLYGRANRAPNSYEHDYDDGTSLVANPQLGRETIDTLELVADAQVASAVNLRASAYGWHMDDAIVLGTDANSGLPQYASGGRVKARGAELSASTAWNGGNRLRASLSWQDVSRADGSGTPANSPEWLARVNYTQPLGANYDLGLELQYDGEREAVDGSMLRGYWLANLNLLAAVPVNGLELTLTLLNLFDERYDHPAADSNWQNRLEQDGRAVRLRMDYRF
ncbi:MAG TPA: TonB-dependent receptor [Pseudomonadales bacterium]